MAQGSKRRSLLAAIRVVLLGGLSALLTWAVVNSWSWSYRHDFPILHYAAWLIDAQGAVPYRDLFEFNMPGTYLLHVLMGWTAGWDPIRIRGFDLVWLFLVLVACVVALRRFGPFAMWGGALAVGLLYLGLGPWMTLQREWLLVLPLLLATALAMAVGPPRFLRGAAMGVLVGVAVTVKPHAALVLPVLVIHESLRPDPVGRTPRQRFLLSLAAASLGFALPVVGAFVWVWTTGGLPAFWEILSRYTPLYSDLTGQHRAVPDGERWRWVIKDFVLRGRTWLVIAAAIPGLLVALLGERRPHVRRAAWLLLALTGIFTVYPLVAGKLWPYHFLPQEVFAALTAALILSIRPGGSLVRGTVATMLLVGAIAIAWFAGELVPRRAEPPRRAEAIAAHLQERLRPGDTVQPLDWTGGAAHAMLLARAPLATRFLYDFHFYHHVSDPYIVHLRSAFVNEMRTSRPAFVIRMTDRRWPRGEDTAVSFPELDAYLAAHYVPSRTAEGYVILVRRDR